ncbi:MAG: hypothetical protein ACJ749_06440 [Flavisolibacter sp.]
MKKVFVFGYLVLLAVSAQAQPAADTATSPAITETGKVNGKKVEKKMDKQGGNLFSADGKVELRIPGGALTKNTTISIQPITNEAPNGNGNAYRLEPSGIHFQQPVQLVFHYSSKQGEEDQQMLKGIAMQGDKGEWYTLKKFTVDTVAKTITGNINHFSDWSTFESLVLTPVYSRLKVGKSVSLEVHLTGPSADLGADELSALDDGMLAPLVKPKHTSYMSIEKWTVDGVTNGNSSVGTVKSIDYMDASYKAPASVPGKNPVAVSAHLKGLNLSLNGQKLKDLRLVANILIYDNAYEVKMTATMKGGSPESWAGAETYKDEGSFIVSLDRGKPEVIEIVNNMETFDNNCIMTVLNPTTCTGMLHIIGVKSANLIPAQPPGQPYATIEITFIPGRTEHIKFQLDCPPPPSTKGRSKSDEKLVAQMYLLDAMTPVLPMQIKFVAKPEEQTVMQLGKEGGEIYVRFSVKQIKDD